MVAENHPSLNQGVFITLKLCGRQGNNNFSPQSNYEGPSLMEAVQTTPDKDDFAPVFVQLSSAHMQPYFPRR